MQKSVFAIITKFLFFIYLFPAVPLHHSVYHRILWCLDKFDVHMAGIKTNAETRRNSWRTYGETRLIKIISCEVLLQKLVHLTNLRIKFF